MLSPQEIRQHSFPKSAFGGYQPAAVMEFLSRISAEVAEAEKEAESVKRKMKVLVTKVDEYRNTEESLRRALVSAQAMADKLLADAQKERDQLVAETDKKRQELEEELRLKELELEIETKRREDELERETKRRREEMVIESQRRHSELMDQVEAEAQERTAALKYQTETEQYRLTAAQNSTAVYVNQLKDLYRSQLDYLGSLAQLTPPGFHYEAPEAFPNVNPLKGIEGEKKENEE